MRVFFYDKTFEGLLCAVFDAYTLKLSPERLLGPDEVASIVREQGLVEVRCEFCGEEYQLGADEAFSLFDRSGAGD